MIQGLPSDSFYFGNHTVTMTVDTYDPSTRKPTTHDSEVAHLQTFFNATATNHPNPTNSPVVANWPNWLYYYNLIYPAQGLTDASGNTQYQVTYHHDTAPSRAHFDESLAIAEGNGQFSWNPYAYTIEIHDDAFISRRLDVFEISPDTTTIPGYGSSNLVRYVGYLDVSGLFSYIAVAAHEQGHVISFSTPYTLLEKSGNSYRHPPFINRPYYSTGDSPDIYATGSDDGAVGSDGTINLGNSHPDHLWDGWEFFYHMNPATPATVSALAYFGSDLTTGLVPIADTSVSNNANLPNPLGNFDVVDD